jgi:hypothetical protein
MRLYGHNKIDTGRTGTKTWNQAIHGRGIPRWIFIGYSYWTLIDVKVNRMLPWQGIDRIDLEE